MKNWCRIRGPGGTDCRQQQPASRSGHSGSQSRKAILSEKPVAMNVENRLTIWSAWWRSAAFDLLCTTSGAGQDFALRKEIYDQRKPGEVYIIKNSPGAAQRQHARLACVYISEGGGMLLAWLGHHLWLWPCGWWCAKVKTSFLGGSGEISIILRWMTISRS